MRTEESVKAILQREYQIIGGAPSDLVRVEPKDGGWEKALSYDVTGSNGKRVKIRRPAFDDENWQEIRAALRPLRADS